MLSRRQFNFSLIAILALAALPGTKSWGDGNGDGLLLDLAEAELFRERNPPALNKFCVSLENYTRANSDALEYLASQGYDGCVSIGLIDLDTSNASVLAKWDVHICFTNLEHLDAEVAAILVAGGNLLEFKNLKALSLEAAGELTWSRSYLGLGLDSISIAVAQELASHMHHLILTLKKPPSSEALEALCHYAGQEIDVYWEHLPGNELCNFISPNAHKYVTVGIIQIFEYGEKINHVSIKEFEHDEVHIDNYLQTNQKQLCVTNARRPQANIEKLRQELMQVCRNENGLIDGLTASYDDIGNVVNKQFEPE